MTFMRPRGVILDTVCNICGMHDTKKSNGDCDWCTECGSVEQGFTYDEQGEDHE